MRKLKLRGLSGFFPPEHLVKTSDKSWSPTQPCLGINPWFLTAIACGFLEEILARTRDFLFPVLLCVLFCFATKANKSTKEVGSTCSFN